MDRFAEQLFGAPDRSYRQEPTIVEVLAKSFAKSAAKRAMDHGTRSRGGGNDTVDWRSVGGLVLEMMSGRDDDKRSSGHRSKRRRERDGETRNRDFDDGGGGSDERRKRRRYEKNGGVNTSPHVTFAEPFARRYNSEEREQKRREHRERRERRARHRRDRDRDQGRDRDRAREAEDEEARSSRHKEERRRSRRSNRKVDLQALRAELEDMSSTIIALNARSANHRDCEFYDKFVSKGGRLQDAIGSTLGQLGQLEEEQEGGGYRDWEYGEGERERERRRRKRRRYGR